MSATTARDDIEQLLAEHHGVVMGESGRLVSEIERVDERKRHKRQSKRIIFGEALTRYRDEHKLSLDDVARKIGRSRQFVHSLEAGRRRPDGSFGPVRPRAETIRLVADALGVDADQITIEIDNV